MKSSRVRERGSPRILHWIGAVLCASLLICRGWSAAPVRTDLSKRVGIVYSQPSATRFYDLFAYSQLFMAMQQESMMAGIPFDLLTEDSLTNVANLVNYDALIFPGMRNVTLAKLPAIQAALHSAVYTYHIGLITADTFMTHDENGTAITGDAYARVKDLFGLQPTSPNLNGSAATLVAVTVTHPAMKGYQANETLYSFPAIWMNVYAGVTGQTPVVLAKLVAGGISYNSALATTTGGRNVFFANAILMASLNMEWSAIQWAVFGDSTPVGLKMGRNKSLFVSRTDMDEAMFPAQIVPMEIPLNNFLTDWKNQYDFVGSFFLDIGNDPANGRDTDWSVSAPLYTQYMAKGNEVGSHSWTHPFYTSQLTSDQLEFEFNESKAELSTHLGVDIIGAAIPGTPESLSVDQQLSGYYTYISGQYGYVDNGFQGGFGWLTPDYSSVYFSISMMPDFSMIADHGYTAGAAEQQWKDQYAFVMRHASQPIVHWMWHDYGPTSPESGYSVAMYTNIIKMAYQDDAEFMTAADAQNRMRSLRNARLTLSGSNPIVAKVVGSDLGTFSVALPAGQLIQSVDNWYAYNQNSVFVPASGGQFSIHLGSAQSAVTRITALPMRAKLTSVTGDGQKLSFAFVGEGQVSVVLNNPLGLTLVTTGADSVSSSGNVVTLGFNQVGSHSATISLSTDHAPVASAQSVTTPQDTGLPITVSGTDLDHNPLTFSVVSGPSHGTLSGIPPHLTYLGGAGYVGSDSFTFKANDGVVDSAPAVVTIAVTKVNHAPVANAQSASVTQDQAAPIVLTGSDADSDILTYAIVQGPTHGSLSGTAPNLTFTPAAGYRGFDGFTFKVNDGTVDSAPAAVAITVVAVNHAPIAQSQSLTISPGSGTPITLVATDADGDPLIYTIVAAPGLGAITGTLPNLIYTPAAGYAGSDSFSFKANDGQIDSGVATISIRITPTASSRIFNSVTGLNLDGNLADWSGVVSFGLDPDDVTGANNLIDWLEASMAHDANNLYLAYRNDGPITINWGYNLYLDTDANPATGYHDEGAIGSDYLIQSHTLYHYTGNGTSWSWASVGSVTIKVLGNTAEFAVPLASIGNPVNINLYFQGDNTANTGGTTQDYYPDNVLGGGTGIRYFQYATAPGVNRPPIANSQSLTVNPGGSLAVILTGSDLDNDPLTYAVVAAPSHGTLTGTAPNLNYSPASGYAGADSFTFKANDGKVDSAAATISINVVAINHAPVAQTQSVSTPQGVAVAVTLSGTDADGNALTYTVLSSPSHGTLSGTAPSLTYTPAAGFAGSDSFTFKVNDGQVDSASATVSVLVVPTTPTRISNPVAGLTIDGNLSDWSGVLSFGLDPDDVTGTSNLIDWLEAWMGHDANNFYVAYRNDGPITINWGYNLYLDTDANPATGYHDEGAIGSDYLIQSHTLYHYTGNGTSWSWASVASLTIKVVGNTAEYSVARSLLGNPVNINLYFQGDNTANTGGTTQDYYPDNVLGNGTGVKYFQYTTSPGANQAPTATSQSLTVNPGGSLAVILTGSDLDNDPLTYAVVAAPSHGTLTGTAPNLNYSPASGYAGADSFTFKANDGKVDSAAATISINVVAINHAPVAQTQSASTPQGVAVAVTLSGTDADGNALTYTVLSSPSHGTLSGTAPSLTYTPAAGFAGSDSFTFKVNDGQVDSASATVSVLVVPTTPTRISNPLTGLTIDGNLSDWSGVLSFGLDPDDVTGTSNLIDWLEAWMAHDANNFYVAYRNDGPITISWGYNLYLDTDVNAATGYHGDGTIGADYLIQSHTIYHYTGTGTSWSWASVGSFTAKVSGNTAEFSFPRSLIGNPVNINLFFLGDNTANAGGTTQDYYPDNAPGNGAGVSFFQYTTSP